MPIYILLDETFLIPIWNRVSLLEKIIIIGYNCVVLMLEADAITKVSTLDCS